MIILHPRRSSRCVLQITSNAYHICCCFLFVDFSSPLAGTKRGSSGGAGSLSWCSGLRCLASSEDPRGDHAEGRLRAASAPTAAVGASAPRLGSRPLQRAEAQTDQVSHSLTHARTHARTVFIIWIMGASEPQPSQPDSSARQLCHR